MRDEENKVDELEQPKLTRRSFLKVAGLFLGGALAAACSTATEEGWQAGDHWRTPTAESLLPGQSPQGTPAPDDLEAFLGLSRLLTGFEDLDPALGQVYLQSLKANPEFEDGLSELYEQAGFTGGSAPDGLEDLEQAGIFNQESSRSLADKIISLWYTGTYEQGEDTVVATFVDSLAWKSLTFTKPPTICGSFGFWAQRPKGNY